MSDSSYRFRAKDALVGGQMLFVAFGATVLVPLLTGMSSSVSLFTAGAGTLLFQLVTRGQVPVFLGSSFAFIAPIVYGVQTWGLPSTLSGLAAAGLVYVALSGLVRWRGRAAIDRFLPPEVTGSVILVIGLVLAPVAVQMALGNTGDGATRLVPERTALLLAALSAGVTIAASLFGRRLIRLVPVLFGMSAGYAASLALGLVDLSAVANAPWIAAPPFVAPRFDWQAIAFLVPVALAPAIEHVGDILAIGSLTGRNYFERPGLHRTLLGDGIATSFAALLGGPPNTTYSEVTGAVALTRAFNPGVMTWAALWAIALSFFGKLTALLGTIPVPVIGGILVLLFGAICVVGLQSLKSSRGDLTEPRTLFVVGSILVLGIGGMTLSAGDFVLKGVGLAGIVGVALNAALPRRQNRPPA